VTSLSAGWNPNPREKITKLVALFAMAIVVAGDSIAQTPGTSVVRFAQELVYKGLPGTPQHVTLFGDPTKPGLYVDRIKFSAGTKVMPHWHPDSVRTVLVLSGTFYFAVGDVFDETKLTAYPAGTLYSEPPGTPHFAWARDGEVILQVTAIGPTGNTPVPPK
jgi:quercetin dioxygenase-like cupin family protein